MKIAEFKTPDGRIAQFSMPDSATPEDAQKTFDAWLVTQQKPPANESFVQEIKQSLQDWARGINPTEVALSTALGYGAFPVVRAVLPKVRPWIQNLAGAVGGGAAAGAVPGTIEANPEKAIEGAGIGIGTGLAFGGIVPGLAKAGEKAIGWGERLFSGVPGRVSTALSEWLGTPAERELIARAVENIPRYVPGEILTSEMAAPAAKSAVLGAMGAGARNRPEMADIYRQIEEKNRMARAAAIAERSKRRIQLEEERKAATSGLYEEAKKEIIPVDRTLETILSGSDVSRIAGKMAESMQQGQAVAKVAGREAIPTLIPEKVTPAPITDYAVEGSVPIGSKYEPAKMSMDALLRLKKGIDAELNAYNKKLPSPLGLTNINAIQLGEARKQLVDWMTKASPKWAEANAKFAEMSPPVNEAAFFETLGEALQKPTAAEGVAAFNVAAKNLPRTFETSTGGLRYQTPEEVLATFSPQGLRAFGGVQKSLQREEELAKHWTAPQTAIKGIATPEQQVGHAAPAGISTKANAIKKMLVGAGSKAEEEVLAEVDRLMANPQDFARVLRALAPAERDSLLRMAAIRIRQSAPYATIPLTVGETQGQE